MKRFHQRVGVLLALLTSGLVIPVSTSSAGEGTFKLKPAAERKHLPRFELETLEGKRLRNGDVEGRVSVISFWATWCTPCKYELSALDAYRQEAGADRLALYAIATDGPETVASVRSIVRQKRWSHKVATDPSGSVAAKLNPRGSVPYTLFLDREGRIAYAHGGYQSGDEGHYAKLLEQLLAE